MHWLSQARARVDPKGSFTSFGYTPSTRRRVSERTPPGQVKPDQTTITTSSCGRLSLKLALCQLPVEEHAHNWYSSLEKHCWSFELSRQVHIILMAQALVRNDDGCAEQNARLLASPSYCLSQLLIQLWIRTRINNDVLTLHVVRRFGRIFKNCF